MFGSVAGPSKGCGTRIAMRYDKTKISFAAFLAIATANIWLPHFINMTQIGVDRC